LEVGDVVRVKHPAIQDFNAGGAIDRSMQIISTRIDQAKGTVDVELFGSTFAPAPLTDGNVRVLQDSFYTAEGTALPNVTSGQLTVDTTLAGGNDITAPASIWYVNGDLTIPAGITLTITGNAQLRVKGHLTVLGTINTAGGGRTTGAGFIGTSVSGDGYQCTINASGIKTCQIVKGGTNEGQFDAFPTLDLDNIGGTQLTGIPTDLRGSAGPNGATSYVIDYSKAGTPIDVGFGGQGGASGAGLAIVCRGMSFNGSGAIDLSGTPGQPGQTEGDATGGDGGHGTPGGMLVLLDGGTSSVPQYVGRVTAIGNHGIDIRGAAIRVQFVPQPRTATADDPMPEPVNAPINFYQANEPTDADAQTQANRNLIEGDIWFDTDNGNLAKRYDGSTWQAMPISWNTIVGSGKPSDNAQRNPQRIAVTANQRLTGTADGWVLFHGFNGDTPDTNATYSVYANGRLTAPTRTEINPPAGEWTIIEYHSDATIPGIMSKPVPFETAWARRLEDGRWWYSDGAVTGVTDATNEQIIAIGHVVTDGIKVSSAQAYMDGLPLTVAGDAQATSNNIMTGTTFPPSTTLGKDGDFYLYTPGQSAEKTFIKVSG
ncbi:MAG: hypothetical protein D6800_11325, partial [Candidatus Zixiibacteriota bacterium]